MYCTIKLMGLGLILSGEESTRIFTLIMNKILIRAPIFFEESSSGLGLGFVNHLAYSLYSLI